MKLQLSILRLAGLLAPREQRAEWYAEWRAELWYVSRASKPSTAFCMGAFKDALWLRRNSPPSPAILRLDSPALCLFVLGVLAAISLLASYRYAKDPRVEGAWYPEARNLVVVSRWQRPVANYPTVRFAEYQAWMSGKHCLFTGLAFYQTLFGTLQGSGHQTPELSIARASDNLFELLKIPAVPPGAGVRLLLSQRAWRELFDHDPRVFGRVVEVAGEKAMVMGVTPEIVWRLPGRVDAWLIEDPASLAALPTDSLGFVLAATRQASLKSIFAPNALGGYDHFDCVQLYDAVAGPTADFLLLIIMSGLILPVTTSLSLGEYPVKGFRCWMFLAAKLALVLLMVYCGARHIAYHGGPVQGLLLGCILAFRWIVVDQRRRCPVCLRLLKNPVRIGRPSQTFLEWYGTELMCTRGHGLLHVTELPGSCYGTQRWMGLDRSWSSLFSKVTSAPPERC